MRRLVIILLGVLLVSPLLFGQENEPGNTLTKYGIVFNEDDYNFPDETHPTYDDNVYHIDFSASSNGDGSIESPYNSVSGITWQSNSSYLFKRGVYYNNSNHSIDISVDSVLIGAYGTGNRPKIRVHPFTMASDGNMLRGVHLFEIPYDVVRIGTSSFATSGNVVYNCEFTEAHLLCRSSYSKVIHNVAHNQPEDGIFFQDLRGGGIDNEVAYNYVYDVNQNWFVSGKSPDGDAIQFSTFFNAHVHHNVLDRGRTGNKFIMIFRDEGTNGVGYWDGTPIPSLVEDNVLIMQSTTTDPFGASYGGSGVYIEEEQAMVFRRNKMYGSGLLNSIYISTTSVLNNFYGNTFFNTGKAYYSFGGNKIYNNTFYNTGAAQGNVSATYSKNNIYSVYQSDLDDGTNVFADQEGWNNLVIDAADSNLSPASGSVLIDAAEWDGANMDSDFTEDMNGTVITQTTNQFDVGAIQFTTPGACDGINISVTGVVVDDTAGRGIGSVDASVGGNGTAPYSYLWSNSETTQDISGLTAGQYSLVVTDDNGCTGSNAFTVNNISSAVDGNVPVDSVVASNEQSPNVGSNLIDNNIESRWSTDVYAATAVFYIPDTFLIDSFSVYFVNADRTNNGAYQSFYKGVSQGVINFSNSSTNNLEYYDVNEIADSIVFYGYGNDENGWTSWGEIELFGSVYSAPAPPASNVFQINFGPDNVLNWHTLNPSNTSVTDGTYTASYGGYATRLDGSSNGVWNDSVGQSNAYRVQSGGSITVPIEGTQSTVDTLQIFISTNDYLFMDIIVEGVTVESNFLTDDNTSILTYTNVAVTGDLDIEILERNGSNVSAINGIRIVEEAPLNPCDTTTILSSGVTGDVSCLGGSDGSVSISTIGGDGNYSYLWSNGATTQNINNVIAAEYSVTVTDNNGCIGTNPFTVSQPDSALTAEFTDFVFDNCYGDDTNSVTVVPKGGTAPYVVYWSDIDVTATKVDTLRANVQYNIEITDANGCVYNTSVVIGTVAQIEFNEELPGVIIPDVNNQGVGAVNSFITGGTQPYTYLWSTGSTNENISNLFAGDYTLTITDGNGCVVPHVYTVPNTFTSRKAVAPGGRAIIINGKLFTQPLN